VKPSGIVIVLSLSMILFIPSMALSDDIPHQTDTTFYIEGEELLYEASWSGINIGTIRLKSLFMPYDSKTMKRKAVAYIDSRSGLPFIDIHMVAYTEMDSSFNSLNSYSYEKQNGGWQKTLYRYRLLEKKIIVEESYQETLESSPKHSVVCDTLKISKTPIQDGISLVFLARHLSQIQDSISYPTVSNEKLGETQFYPLRPHSKVNIEAWKKPVDVVELSGKMILEGIFGLTGNFKGWFSNDAAAIPITAEMKVILGSVKIELKEWNRKDWNPPE
jgi:hypothetical protein